MSRRAFRATVDSPRPASAWLLVGVASATVWITEQLEPWALALQVVGLLTGLLRRERPFDWQRSGLVMNCAMFAILAISVSIGLRSGPSTIALAHFAALTQALQLLDARPRRTEFLLVTLALFQVVLASNLTDSVWFTPLLIAFVFSSVWTLLVHTLHMEAIEAGTSSAVTRALTPGLWRVTLVASALSVVLALLMFVSLPRLHGSVVTGSPLGATLAAAGFSDRVSLGDLGRIRQDSSTVMRIETLDGRPPDFDQAYWRAVAFDHFDGTSWSITPSERRVVPGSPESGVTIGHRPDQVNLVQRIVREPVASGALFGAGDIRILQGTIRALQRDENGGLYSARQARERVRYVVSTFSLAWKDPALRRDEMRPPIQSGRLDHRYEQLPEMSPRVTELARSITAGIQNPADRVRAIERHLIVNGLYTDVPPALDGDTGVSPVEQFLFGGLAGHCEYFASSMVLLTRALGVSARLVNGFAGGRENSVGGFRELRRSDAHSWVEVHYGNAGWVRYDPTPPDLRAGPQLALSFGDQLREFGSAFELWWYQRVLGFDRADQVYAIKRAWLAWQSNRSDRQRAANKTSVEPRRRLDTSLEDWQVAAVSICGAAVGVGFLWRRRRQKSKSAVPASYAVALGLLARHGLERAPSDTAREFSRCVRGELSREAGEHFADLTESYLAERFGGAKATQARDQLEGLRRSLRSPAS